MPSQTSVVEDVNCLFGIRYEFVSAVLYIWGYKRWSVSWMVVYEQMDINISFVYDKIVKLTVVVENC